MKVFAVILSFVFALTSSGLHYNLHYCKGKLASIGLYETGHECHGTENTCPMHREKTCCKKPGPKKKKDCCKDERIDISIDQPFVFSKTGTVQPKAFHIDNPVDLIEFFIQAQEHNTTPGLRGPPLKTPAQVPLYIQFQTLTYYG